MLTHLCCRFDRGSVLEQQLDDLDPVLLAGDVQRRESVQRARVHLALAVEQQLGGAHIAAVRSHVKRSQVVLRTNSL